MRIHVEGEERLQQQNSALQFQLADQQRLAADLGRSAFVLTSIADPDTNPDPSDPYIFGPTVLDPDPDPLVRGMDPDPDL